jgi:uncharacterized protein YpmB
MATTKPRNRTGNETFQLTLPKGTLKHARALTKYLGLPSITQLFDGYVRRGMASDDSEIIRLIRHNERIAKALLSQGVPLEAVRAALAKTPEVRYSASIA